MVEETCECELISALFLNVLAARYQQFLIRQIAFVRVDYRRGVIEIGAHVPSFYKRQLLQEALLTVARNLSLSVDAEGIQVEKLDSAAQTPA